MTSLSDWFAVFRAGTHTDSRGRTSTFSGEDLDGIVAAYDSASPSPCVVTHEELYSLFAYAKVGEIQRNSDMLKARCDADSIEPLFAKLVEDGRLHNRSLQIVPHADGSYRRGHVAFLGAEPPAVEGLAPISFSAAGMKFTAEEAWEDYRDASSIARIMGILRQLAVRRPGARRSVCLLMLPPPSCREWVVRPMPLSGNRPRVPATPNPVLSVGPTGTVGAGTAGRLRRLGSGDSERERAWPWGPAMLGFPRQ